MHMYNGSYEWRPRLQLYILHTECRKIIIENKQQQQKCKEKKTTKIFTLLVADSVN